MSISGRLAYVKRYLINRSESLKSQEGKASYKLLVENTVKAIMQLIESPASFIDRMMSHGKGAFKRAIMGSMADEILRHSFIPVLIIRV